MGTIRNDAKLSARELSLRLDKSIAYIAKFDNGDFSIPAEILLDAIKICGSTPEEFFADNYRNYKNEKEFITLYRGLSPQSKEMVLNLMKNMK